MAPQFWPPAEFVQRGSLLSGAAGTVVTFPVPFAAAPKMQVTVVSASTSVVAEVALLSATSVRLASVQLSPFGYHAGDRIFWEARA